MAEGQELTHAGLVFYEYLAKCYQTWPLNLLCAEANEVNAAGVDRGKLHVVTRSRCVIEVSVARIDAVVAKVIHDN